MRFLRAVMVGILAAVAASSLYVLVVVLWAMFPLLLSRSEGVSAVGFVIDGAMLVAVAVLAFAGGFYWRLRRDARARKSVSP